MSNNSKQNLAFNTPVSPRDALTTTLFPQQYRALPDQDIDLGNIAEKHWRIADLVKPAMVIRKSAIEHNARLHARWAESLNASLAPHNKTHMSPEIARLQLAEGAWGLTAATVSQARFLLKTGAKNILIANEVIDSPNLTLLSQLITDHPDVSFFFLVDSVAGARCAENIFQNIAQPFQANVLIEYGMVGGRTGVREMAEAFTIAEEIAKSPTLNLAGVEFFEGIMKVARDEETVNDVIAYIDRAIMLLEQLDQQGAFGDNEEIIFTGGGSSYPDLVANLSNNKPVNSLSKPVRIVVRAGATIVHDYGHISQFAPLSAEQQHPMGQLIPAVELWATVTSVPETSMAILGFGKRDAPYDSQMPVVLAGYRNGAEFPTDGIKINRMNDQHAYAEHENTLQVGDSLKLGPNHPCTVFDKWNTIPLVDDEDTIVGAITTYF